jgi:peptidoglycan/LPS O-acetylase OafA/YrhL
LTTILVLACILVLYPDNILVPSLNRSILVTYQALSRPCWALSIVWILFLCGTNQGGVVNTILSWPIWLPLSRLNYSAFLIHSLVLYTTIYNQKEPTYCDVLVVMNKFISNLFYSYVAAIVVVIFFENPFLVLEKKLFHR